MAAARKSQGGAPLPAKLAGLLREAKWLALVAAAGYLLLILLTHHASDPGWSRSATAAVVQNAGGRVGAWLSDVLLSLFGWSAFWWVALCLYIVVRGYRRIEDEREDRSAAAAAFRSRASACCCVASAALEYLRLHSFGAGLPQAAGGIIGMVLGELSPELLGFTGATLLMLAAVAVGWSLFSGISWLRIAEVTGLLLESAYALARGAWEQRRDEKIGEQARDERETVVQAETQARGGPPAAGDRAAAARDQALGARAEGEAGAALRAPARHAAAAAQAARRAGEGNGNGQRRDAGIHLAPDREEALRFRRRGEGARRLSGPGDHALRDRARGRRQGQPDRQPDQGPRARAVGGGDPRRRDHSRASPAWAWRSRIRTGRWCA